MIVGNACIVCHNDKWLRAEFIEKPVNDTIKVCFVDYGTIDVVSTSQCHYISKYFSAIPKCCYPGALESIDPIDNSDIELALVQSFCELIRNKPLAGLVTEVDRKVSDHFRHFVSNDSRTILLKKIRIKSSVWS